MNPSDTFTKPNWDGDFHRLREDYELFYDDEGRVSQFRLHLKDEDPEIKNKCICVSRIHFKKPVNLFYERHKIIGNKKIIEFYENDEMHMYAEITTENSVKIDKGFSPDGYLIYEDKTFYDANGKEGRYEHWVASDDGTLYDSYD